MEIILLFLTIQLVGIGGVFAQSGHILITAHRGASGHAPENTIASMEAAINMKADLAELDVQETVDGEIVLFHDRTMKRLAGIEKEIGELTIQEIQKLEVGSWFDLKFKGEPIPTLSDVVDFVRGKIKLNIELKTTGHEKQLAERLLNIVKEKNFEKECFFTSFDYSQIKRIKELDPSIRTGLIFKTIPNSINIYKSDFEILSVDYSLVNEEFIRHAFSNGKEVHVWTVNNEDEMKRLIELNVTSIITNYPDKLRNLLNNIRE